MARQAVVPVRNKRKMPEPAPVVKKGAVAVKGKGKAVEPKKPVVAAKGKGKAMKKKGHSDSDDETESDESSDDEMESDSGKESSGSDSSDSASESESESESDSGSDSESESESGSSGSDSSDSASESESESESDSGSDSESESESDESESEDEQPKKPTKEAPKKGLGALTKASDSEFTVFVGNLPFDVDDKKLAKGFEKFGAVRNARVVKDKKTAKSKGIGFVDFETKAVQEEAIKANGSTMFGRTIRVDAASSNKDGGAKPTSRPSPVLFIGNLSYTTTEKKLKDVFGKYGNVVLVRIPTAEADGKSKGFGYVHFDNVKSAIAAMDGMVESQTEIDKRRPRIDFDTSAGRK